MKKILFFGLALLVLGSALFADDAKVMPMRVGRFYLAPSFIFGDKAFNKDGERVNNENNASVKALNLAMAVEYGVIDWITAAVQWVPGINIWSKMETDPALSSGGMDLFGVGDLFVGAKIQIIGSAAPVKTDNFRLALAAGVKIPLFCEVPSLTLRPTQPPI
jgi:hypothetical protein